MSPDAYFHRPGAMPAAGSGSLSDQGSGAGCSAPLGTTEGRHGDLPLGPGIAGWGRGFPGPYPGKPVQRRPPCRHDCGPGAAHSPAQAWTGLRLPAENHAMRLAHAERFNDIRRDRSPNRRISPARLHGAPRLACIMLPARPERARPEFPARPANCASDGTNRHVRPAGEWLRAFGHRFPMRADCFGPPDDLERSLFGLERSPGPLPLPWLHSGAAMQRARWQEAVREGAGAGRTCD